MRFIFCFFLLISLHGFGQWKSYKIGVRGDTLNRVDMKGLKQGPWVLQQPELRGEPGYEEQGYFVNDKKDGMWVKFSLMGDKIAEENYRFGALDGKCKYYNKTGALMRIESWRAVDPNKTMDTVDVYDLNDPTKIVDRVVVRLEGLTNKHGTWTYYDADWGNVIKTEKYFLDKLHTGNMTGTDDELKPIDVSDGKSTSDTATKKTVAKPQAILDYEKKNSGKKKVKVRDGKTGQ
jgi:hypothetical protein